MSTSEYETMICNATSKDEMNEILRQIVSDKELNEIDHQKLSMNAFFRILGM